MKKRNMLMAALAAVMVLALSVPSALAYFTTYTTAKGTVTLHLSDKTRIVEEVDDSQKKVTIVNEGEVPLRVRALAFAPDAVSVQENYGNNPDWTKADDGYWYYGKILQPGESTSQLIFFLDLTNVELEEINVVVVYEATYNLDNEGEADWSTGGVINE